MILVRDVFQAKYGRGDELVAVLKDLSAAFPSESYRRILTDASGPFFTVVAETEVANLGDWEKQIRSIFSRKDFAGWFERMVPLVESGRREFYNIEVNISR